MSRYILNVPYKSQNDPDAQTENNDCGPACVAMVLLTQGHSVATSEVYAASSVAQDRALSFAEVTAAAAHFGLPLNARIGMSLQDLRNYIDQGTPVIALVKYLYLPDRQGQSTTGGHFVLVVGYDDDAGEIVINDPYYWASLRDQGNHHHYSYNTWEQAWGRCNEDGNPNHSALIPQLTQPVAPLPDYAPTPPPPGTVFVLPAADKYSGLKLRPVRDTNVAGQPIFSGRPLTVVEGPVTIGNVTWALVRTQSADDIAGWACVQSGGEAYIGDKPGATTPTTMSPITPPTHVVYVQPDADKYGGLKLRPVRDTNVAGPAEPSGTALDVVAEPIGAAPHEWLLVTAQDGKDTAGWVHTRQANEVYVSDTPPGGAPPVVPVPPKVADLWVIAPDGLLLRTQRDVPAGPGSPTALFGQHLTALDSESAPDAQGRTWIQVRTDDGLVAWALASENGVPYLSNIQPYRAEVFDTQPVRDAGGLHLRDQRSIDVAVVDTLQIGQQFDVYYRTVESDGTPWLWVKSPNNKYGWAREKAEGVVLVGKASQPQPIPQPPPQPLPATLSALSKLGAHVLSMNDDTAKFIAAGPSVVKFVGDWGYAPAVPQGTLVIGRKVLSTDDDAQQIRARGLSPQQGVHDFIFGKENQIQTYQSNPAIKYWEGHNEPVWGDEEGMKWYADFEIERMQQMEKLGLKCVIGNFATGTPPENLWPAFLPAVQAAAQYGALLGLHEYSCPWMWWMTGRYQVEDENCVDPRDPNRIEGWTTLRYRKVYREYLEPAGLGNVPLVITEFGLDPGVGPQPKGCPGGAWRNLGGYWRQHRDDAVFDHQAAKYPQPADVPPYANEAQFYAEQLKWIDREMRQDAYVLGATIFTFGSFGGVWAAFDVTSNDGCAPLLTEYVLQLKAAPPSPPPPSTPQPATLTVQPAVTPYGGLKVRVEHNLNANFVKVLPAGAQVTVLEGPIIDGGDTWLRVCTASGKEGWVRPSGDGETYLA